MKYSISDRLKHFFHVVSNVRPIVWIAAYVALVPVFAVLYWLLPDGQFRIPDGGTTDFGSWIYYSIVTITTLGFGDYTPCMGWSQTVTAVEVMCGLILLGLFLNAVGSMKSEIDVESELEKQRRLHYAAEHDKLVKIAPNVKYLLDTFMAYCYAVTTPLASRKDAEGEYNADFTVDDMKDMYEPSGLPIDNSKLPAVQRLMHSATHTALALDSMQMRVDLSLWPDVLDDCFGFVAAYQMYASADELKEKKQTPDELYNFIKESAGYATRLEAALQKAVDTAIS